MITLLPSKNRKELLKRFLDSAIECDTKTDGLILIDEKDWESHDYNLKTPETYKFKVTKAVTMGDKVREVWDEVKHYESVCLLNDDHVIKTKNWDTKVCEKVKGYNFVTTNDNWRSPQKASGATVWSMPLLDAVGWPIFPPGMTHLFIDDIWEYFGRMTGCWNIDHSVLIEHHHPLTGKINVDQTFIDTYGTNVPQDFPKSELWQKDQAVFNEIRQKQGLEIVNKIRNLMGLCYLGGQNAN